MRVKDRLGIKFIKASMPFINTENLYIMLSMVEGEMEELEQRERLKTLIKNKIERREKGLEVKTLTKEGKEVWVAK